MAKKKKKTNIAKKRAKSNQKRKQKKLKSKVNDKQFGHLHKMFDPDFYEIPSIIDIEPPEGYIVLSTNQAIVELSRKLFDKVLLESKNKKVVAKCVKSSMFLWNYCQLNHTKENNKKLYEGVMSEVQLVLGISKKDTVELIERAVYLYGKYFPEDIQPDILVTTFMKKDRSVKIKAFDYNFSEFNEIPVSKTDLDIEIVKGLNCIDKYVDLHKKIHLWEDEYKETEKNILQGYKIWLDKKGLTEYKDYFSDAVEFFMGYVYIDDHSWETKLNDIMPEYLEVCFYDHMLREPCTVPEDFALKLPGVKYFYFYLEEIGYMECISDQISHLEEIEIRVLAFLKKQYE